MNCAGTRAGTRRAGAWSAGCVFLACAAAQAAPAGRYEVDVDPSPERLAVHACFAGKALDALVAQSDGARLYLESMRIGERALEGFTSGCTGRGRRGAIR